MIEPNKLCQPPRVLQGIKVYTFEDLNSSDKHNRMQMEGLKVILMKQVAECPTSLQRYDSISPADVVDSDVVMESQ
jgi:hypothetical protein